MCCRLNRKLPLTNRPRLLALLLKLALIGLSPEQVGLAQDKSTSREFALAKWNVGPRERSGQLITPVFRFIQDRIMCQCAGHFSACTLWVMTDD